MKSYVFTVDGVEYRRIHVLSLKRSFAVLDGENAGRTMDGKMQRDVIGTYYNYSLVIDPSDSDPAEYDALYECLSSPQGSHKASFPDNRGELSFEAYVANGEDELRDIFNGQNRWDNLTINFVSMEPQRRPAE